MSAMQQDAHSHSNKIALVTGASRGIGASTALLLARNGYDVAVNYLHNKDDANTIVNQIKKIGMRAVAIKADVGDEQEIIDMFSVIDNELGNITALVNNGGVSSGFRSIEEVDFHYLEQIYKPNVFGAFVCCREAIQRMKSNKSNGAIVNVSSLAGELGGLKMSAYASSKAAISNLTIGLAKEIAVFGIRVNAVAPGVINTDAQKEISSERRAYLEKSIPLGRMGRAQEVAEAILWLLTNKSSYVTGSTLNITGGK